MFNAITAILSTDKTTATGAKCCINFPHEAKIVVEVLREYLPSIKIIFVRRMNLVAQYGSHRYVKKHKVSHSWSPGAERLKISKITINKWLFTRYVINSRAKPPAKRV